MIRAVILTRTPSKALRCVRAVAAQEGIGRVDQLVGLTRGWDCESGDNDKAIDAVHGLNDAGAMLVPLDYTEFNFSRMNNELARTLPKRHYSHLLILNDDVYLEQPDALAKMLHALEEEQPFPAAVGLKLVYPPGHVFADRIQHVGCWPGPYRLGCHRGRHAVKDAPDYSRPGTVDVWAVTGAAMLVKRRDFEKVGGFDEEYYDIGQDNDLCMKLAELFETYTYNVTSKCRVVQSTYGYHEEGATRRVWGDFIGAFAFYDFMALDAARFREKWLHRTVRP